MSKFLMSSGIIAIIFLLFLIGCEAENPGEPIANKLPDTYISKATAGNITTIYFYGTDKDGYIKEFIYKWDNDTEWLKTVSDSLVFIDIFANENEVKTFYVKAIDNLDAEDPYPAEIALSPNNILPETSISFGPDLGDITGEDVQFIFEGSDFEEGGEIVSFQYTLDDLNNWKNTPIGSSKAVFLGIAEGAHTFYVRAVDNLGGVDPSPAQSAFIVRSNHHSPEIINHSSIRSGGGWIAGYPIQFVWEASINHYFGILPNAPYSFSIDDSTGYNDDPNLPLSSGWCSATEFIHTPNLGIHNFYLKVRDTAGGISLLNIYFEAGNVQGLSQVLVVCDMQASSHGNSFINKINNGDYWGNVPVSFWDNYGDMTNPQPEFSLPSNAHYLGGGTGVFDPVNIWQYTTLIWLGDIYNNSFWQSNLISQFLQQGGNIILATTGADYYLDGSLKSYLNITFGQPYQTGYYGSFISEYISLIPGLMDFGPPFESQMHNTFVYQTLGFNDGADLQNSNITNWNGSRSFSKTPYTTLLFAHRDSNYDPTFSINYVGLLGVWAHPYLAFRSLNSRIIFPVIPSGGNFILISGAHSGYNKQPCRNNFEFMLRNMCGEN